MKIELEQIRRNGICCVSGKPLKDSTHLNFVPLPYLATWDFPIWANMLLNHPCHFAMAFVHDECIGENDEVIGEVLYAVEFTDDEIIYHALETLENAMFPVSMLTKN